jgi:hypothetical protein
MSFCERSASRGRGSGAAAAFGDFGLNVIADSLFVEVSAFALGAGKRFAGCAGLQCIG